MRSVGEITSVSPDKRVQSLMNFRKRLAENQPVRFLSKLKMPQFEKVNLM